MNYQATHKVSIIFISCVLSLLGFKLSESLSRGTAATRPNQEAFSIRPSPLGIVLRQTATGGTHTETMSEFELRGLQQQLRKLSENAETKSQLSYFNTATAAPREFKIELSLSGEFNTNPAAKAAMERAASYWANTIRGIDQITPSEFTLPINVSLGATAFGKPFTIPGTVLMTTMPRFPSGLSPVNGGFNGAFGRIASYQQQRDVYELTPTPLVTDLGSTTYIETNLTHYLARGVILFNEYPPHAIAFNSTTAFDYDASDGVEADKLDFETYAMREIGRFLGFISNAGVTEVRTEVLEGPTGERLLFKPTMWDYFRFRPGVTMATMQDALRVLRSGGEQVFFTGDLEVPLASGVADVREWDAANGGMLRDNRAAGHWQDDAVTGLYYGIMDASYLPGERGRVTATDLKALSYQGLRMHPQASVMEVLSHDDNSREQTLAASNAWLVNRFTPAQAPYNLEAVKVQLPDAAAPGKSLRIIVFADAQRTGQPSANPALLSDRTITIPALPAHRWLEVILPSPVTINAGDVYVAVQAVGANFTLAADMSAPRGRSFISTNNGASFQPLTSNNNPANAMLRAVVNYRFNVVNNRPPELASLSSTRLPAGASQTLTVFGAHFFPDSADAAGLTYKSVIRINGQNRTTEFLAHSRLRTTLSSSDLSAGATLRVTVLTQNPGGSFESAPLELRVSSDAPVPSLSSVFPTVVAVAGNQRDITLHGRNFTEQSVVRANNANRTTRFISDHELAAELTAADLAQAGSLALSVNTPTPGGGASNTLALPVAGCTYTLSSNGKSYPQNIEGQTLDSFVVDTQAHCPWTAATNAGWIKLEGSASANGRGPVVFTVQNNPTTNGRTAAINIAGAGGNRAFTLTQPSGLSAVSAASYQRLTAVGAIASIFGTNLSQQTQVAATTPLPLTLGGVRVTVRNFNNTELACPLFFVSPTQINFQIAPNAPVPPSADQNLSIYNLPLAVYVNDILTASGTIQLADVVPSLFTANANGQGVPAGLALRVKADGTQSYEPLVQFDNVQSRFVPVPLDLGPVGERIFVVLFGTGFQRRSSLENVSLTGNFFEMNVPFAGPQGTLVGVDQLNAELPRELVGRGDVTLRLRADGRDANPVVIRVK